MPLKRKKTKTIKNQSENIIQESDLQESSSELQQENKSQKKSNNKNKNENHLNETLHNNNNSPNSNSKTKQKQIENELTELSEARNKSKMKLYREYSLHHITPVFYGIGSKKEFISYLVDNYLNDGYVVRLDACQRELSHNISNNFSLFNSDIITLNQNENIRLNKIEELSNIHFLDTFGLNNKLTGVEKLRKTLLSIFDFVFGISDISVDASPVEISRRLTDLCNKAYKDAIVNGNRPVKIYLIIEGVDELIKDTSGSRDSFGYSMSEQNNSNSLYIVEDTLSILVDNSLVHMFITIESIRGTHFLLKNMIPVNINTNIKYSDEITRSCVENLSQECTEDNTGSKSYTEHGFKKPSLEALEMIMKSLTPNHADLIRLLGALMLQSNMKGVSKKELLTACRKSMIVTTVDRMQTLLTEFLDHKVIVSRERCEPGINEETTFYILNFDKQTTEKIRYCEDLTRIFSG